MAYRIDSASAKAAASRVSGHMLGHMARHGEVPVRLYVSFDLALQLLTSFLADAELMNEPLSFEGVPLTTVPRLSQDTVYTSPS